MTPDEKALVDVFQHIFRAANGSACYEDGDCTVNTLDVEMIERYLHNVFKEFLPDHPDRMALPCKWDCDYCRANDAGNT